VTRYQLFETLMQLLVLFSTVFSHEIPHFLHISFCMFTPVWTFKQVCMNLQKLLLIKF